MTEPTPVTPVDAEPAMVTDRLGGVRVEVDDSLRQQLRDVCEIVDEDNGSRSEAARDWWPLAIGWAVEDLRAHGAAGTPEEVAERFLALGAAGADTVYLQILDLSDLDHLRLLSESVLPHLA